MGILMVVLGLVILFGGGGYALYWSDRRSTEATQKATLEFANLVSLQARSYVERLIANCNVSDTSTMSEAHQLIERDLQTMGEGVKQRVLDANFSSDSIALRTQSVRVLLETYYLPKAIKAEKTEE